MEPSNDINKMAETYLQQMLKFNKTPMKPFIDAGGDINHRFQDKLTFMHCMARLGFYSQIMELYRYGADVNCLDRDNRTPLFYAISRYSSWCVDILLEYGAKPSLNDADWDGYNSAFDFANKPLTGFAFNMSSRNKIIEILEEWK